MGKHLRVVGRTEQSPWPALLDGIVKVPESRRACTQPAGVGVRDWPSPATEAAGESCGMGLGTCLYLFIRCHWPYVLSQCFLGTRLMGRREGGEDVACQPGLS